MILPDEYNVPDQTKSLFYVPNPIKYKMQKLGKESRFYPYKIFLGQGEMYPPGAPYWSIIKGFGKVEITNPEPLVKESTSIDLRPEQIPVFESCKKVRCALVEFKTGSGKSVIACALAECWGGKTLIVTNTRDNVRYFQAQFEKFLDIDAGAYYGDEKNMKDVTITTFNTAVLHASKFKEFGFDNLIIDEADVFFTEPRRGFTINFPATRKFAFTGTIKTEPDEYLSRKSTPALVRFWGLHVIGASNKDKDPLEAIFWRNRQKKYFDQYNFPISPAKQWDLFRKTMNLDENRKLEQLSYVSENHDKGKDHTLVLLDRVADVERYYADYRVENAGARVYKMHGKINKSERKDSLDEFNRSGGILFAQYKTAGRGLDLPNCSKLFILFPCKGENSLRQMVGRVVRWIPGKKSYVYDWVDSDLDFQWKRRQRVYKEFFKLTPQQI